ncbi:MAG: toll/interleukin-1 receptor domain-containing protein, partial [Hyphomicrobium sp.]
LFEELRHVFSRDQVFMDVTDIEPGLDFKTVLKAKVESCDVLIAVIGKGWLDEIDRLAKEDDLCRFEIETALKRGIRVVPVLVDGAKMMDKGALPPSLQPFSTKQAIRLSSDSFENDAASLIAVLKKDVKPRRTGWFGWGSAQRAKPKANPSPAKFQAGPKPPEAAPQGPPETGSWLLLLPAALAASSVWLVYRVSEFFLQQGGTWSGAYTMGLQGSIDGVVAGVVGIFVLAWLLARLAPKQSGVFHALCWLAWIVPMSWAFGEVAFATGIFLPDNSMIGIALGYFAASVVAAVSALIRMRRRRGRLSATEAGITAMGVGTGAAFTLSYWLGPTLTGVFGSAASGTSGMIVGWFAGSLLALMLVGLAARRWGAPFSAGALLLYWAVMTGQVLAFSWWWYASWPSDVQQAIGASLAISAAVSVVLLLGRARSVQTQA